MSAPKIESVDQFEKTNARTIDEETFYLSVKNPNGGEEVKHHKPQEIRDEITARDTEMYCCIQGRKGLRVHL
jgi:type I restriction enzyme M protein